MNRPVRFRGRGAAASAGAALGALLLGLSTIAASPARSAADHQRLQPPPLWKPHVLARYVHDKEAFIQGLVYYGGYFYESTGLYGRSSLRQVVPKTGEVVHKIDLPETYFAEGLARVDNKLLQITWRENVAFKYDLESFNKEDFYRYDTEGWGLCLDESHPGGAVLYMSDGSSSLTLRNPITFAPLSQITVTLDGTPRDHLNELECVGDKVYANVWLSDDIFQIDKMTGQVTAVINAADLLTPTEINAGADVLNGIAYDAFTQHFFITGKLWPALFEVVWEGEGAATPPPPSIFIPLGWKKK